MVIRSGSALDRVFHALSDSTRRRIVEKLARRELAVMELARQFDISQPAVTKHLNVLAEAGLITRRREGRLRYCRLRPEALEGSLDWIGRYRRLWNGRLDTLEELLAEEATRTEGRADDADR